MSVMNVGFWLCIVLVPGFLLTGIVFAVLKERGAKFVSGFNTLPEKEQELYDKAWIVRDIRNSSFIWSAIMLVGAILSYFLTGYIAAAAYIIWGIWFFKDVHWDAHKAFKKYLRNDKDGGADR